MATVDQIAVRQDAAVTALENATEELLEQKEIVKSAPRIANEAKAVAETALTKSQAAVDTANNALPLAGGYITGSIRSAISSTDITERPTANRSSMPLIVEDKNKVGLGALQFSHYPDGTLQGDIHVSRTVGDATGRTYSRLCVNIAEDGTAYATAPHPRTNNYGNDLLTTKFFIDNCRPLMLSTNAYVGDVEGASDTADLWEGRGLTPEKPFRSFGSAWVWLSRHSNNDYVTLNLMSDLEWDAQYPWFESQSLNTVVIQSYPNTTKKKLILPNGAKVFSSMFTFSNLEINFPVDGNHNGLWAQGGYRGAAPFLQISNCTFSGHADTILYALGRGFISLSGTIDGSVTGKKYSITNGSLLVGASKAVGTIEGTHDASSDVV